MSVVRKREHVKPYTALADIYDIVMNHVNYKRWANYIDQIAVKFSSGSKWIADIACGTGALCCELANLGYTTSGSDNSLDMIKVAKSKFSREKKRSLFWIMDMKLPGFNEKPDMIVALYDSMNYLMSDKNWHQLLNNVYSSLKKDGLFVFDVSTVSNSIRGFHHYIQKETFAAGSYLRKSEFDERNSIQKNYFEIRYDLNPQITYCESHKQTIHSLDQVIGFIDDCPFELVGYFNNFSFNMGSEQSERVHFVLRK